MSRRTLTAAFTALFLLSWNNQAHAAYVARSTSYCLHGTMSDDSYTRYGSVASNWHPLGTRIYITSGSFFGRKRFVVRDRIGWGSELDFWSPTCSLSAAWGRRTVRYVVGWPRYHARRVRVFYVHHKGY